MEKQRKGRFHRGIRLLQRIKSNRESKIELFLAIICTFICVYVYALNSFANSQLNLSIGKIDSNTAKGSVIVSSDLISFIKDIEGGPISRGDFYIVHEDNYGNAIVGPGLLIASYPQWNVKIGDTISKSEVDKVFIQHLESFAINIVNYAKEKGVILEQRQIDALISRSYNCGISSAYVAIDYMSQHKEEEGYAGLWNSVMCKPFTHEGTIQSGLLSRRELEMRIFTRGIYMVGCNEYSFYSINQLIDFGAVEHLNIKYPKVIKEI